MHTHALLLASTAPATSPSPVGVAAPAPAGQSAAAASSSLPDISISWGSYFEALAILCFVLAVVWALLWFLKKRGGGAIFATSAPSMRIESRLALGPKKWLYIVRCLEKRLVLGVGDKSITLISETPLSKEEIEADNKRGIFGRKDKPAFSKGGSVKADSFAAKPPAEPAPDFAAFLKDDIGSGKL